MSMLRVCIVALAIAMVNGGPAVIGSEKAADDIESNTINVDSLARCSYSEGITGVINCAATRALKALQKAASTESIEILPGIALTSDNPLNPREGKSATDVQLPTDPKQKAEKLLSLILNAATRFLSGRTLRIQLPEVSSTSIARAIEEGRGKMKKISPLIFAIGAKAIILKGLMILGLGFIALKALVVSKIALVLAVIGAVQTLFNGGAGFGLKSTGPLPLPTPFFGGHGWISGWGGGSSGSPSYGPSNYNPGWTTNSIGGWSNSQYPYARSIDNVSETSSEETKASAQELAYSKRKP